MSFKKHALRVAGGAGLFTGGIALGRLLRLDSQRGDYRRAWEDNDLATLEYLAEFADRPKDERPYTIIALGDSAAQGIGASRVEEGYVPRLSAAIQQILGREVALLNFSLSGGTTESVILNQLPQVAGLDLPARGITVDAFTLNIGGNDVAMEDLSTSGFKANMDIVLSALPAPTLVANIPSFGLFRSESRAAEFSSIIDEEVRSQGHALVDIRSFTEELSLANYTFTHHAADLFHPNSVFYAQWAQCFVDVWAAVNGHATTTVAGAPTWQMRSVRLLHNES